MNRKHELAYVLREGHCEVLEEVVKYSMKQDRDIRDLRMNAGSHGDEV